MALDIDHRVPEQSQSGDEVVHLPDVTTTSSEDLPRKHSVDSLASDISLGNHMKDILHGHTEDTSAASIGQEHPSESSLSKSSMDEISLNSDLSSEGSFPSKSSNSSISKAAYKERRSSIKPMSQLKEDEPVVFTLGEIMFIFLNLTFQKLVTFIFT